MTSTKIMKLAEGKTYTFYRAACDCGHPDHDITLSVSMDHNSDHVELDIITNSFSSDAYYHPRDSWFMNLYHTVKFRAKGVFDIIFNGYHKSESIFQLRGDEQIDAFVDAVKEGQTKIKEWQSNK